MEKYIPYGKLSKKEKRKLDAKRRTTWGVLNPVTRKAPNSRAYQRSKARNWKRDCHDPVPGFFLHGWFFSLQNVGLPFIIKISYKQNPGWTSNCCVKFQRDFSAGAAHDRPLQGSAAKNNLPAC